MGRTAILKAFEDNLWDRAAYLAKSRKAAEIQELSDLLVVDSVLPCAPINAIGKSTLHQRFADGPGGIGDQGLSKKVIAI